MHWKLEAAGQGIRVYLEFTVLTMGCLLVLALASVDGWLKYTLLERQQFHGYNYKKKMQEWWC